MHKYIFLGLPLLLRVHYAAYQAISLISVAQNPSINYIPAQVKAADTAKE